jgi:hypothetical protein
MQKLIAATLVFVASVVVVVSGRVGGVIEEVLGTIQSVFVLAH